MKTADRLASVLDSAHATRTRGQSSQRTAKRSPGTGGGMLNAPQAPAREETGPVQRRLDQAFGAVQRHSDVGAWQARGQDPQRIHQAAAHGTSGAGAPLPYLQQIQASFGRFDVSGVQSYTGTRATQAAQQMGASAFTVGNRVAFAGTPSLHTAAHEAAHAVQQRAGVQLKGGVGQVGDPYERHADAVADAVVAGRSAESILAAAPASGGSAQAVQCRKTVGFEFQAGNAHIFHAVREVEVDDLTSQTGKKASVEPLVKREEESKLLRHRKRDPTKAESMAKHDGSMWVEHRRIGKGGTGKGGGIAVDQWYRTVKPVIEASSGEQIADRTPSREVEEVGETASDALLYQRDDSDPIVDLTSEFKCTGDGSELEIVTIPAEDSFERMDQLFSRLESYVKGLEAAPVKWYRVATIPKKGAKQGKLSVKQEQLKMTKVADGYIGVHPAQRLKARPQATYSLKFSEFPDQLKTFSQKDYYREAKAGATTQKALAKLAAIDRSALPDTFKDMDTDAFGMLMYLAHIVVVARHSAPDSLGKDLAALAPRSSLRAELKPAARKAAFTDENLMAILKLADSTIKLTDPLTLKDSDSVRDKNTKSRNPKPHLTIGQYLNMLRSTTATPSAFLSRIIGTK